MTQHIIVLRHGRTDASVSGEFTGRRDVPLNAIGHDEAASWRLAFEALPWSYRAFASPLQRASHTAELAGLDADPLELVMEWDLGALDGQHADSYRNAHPDWSLFSDGAPNGESPSDIQRRIDSVLTDVCDRHETTILVTHGQFSKAFIIRALGLPLSFASSFSLGPARAGLLLRRAHGLSLAGWNLRPSPDLWNSLT